jgi:hypothetical protein
MHRMGGAKPCRARMVSTEENYRGHVCDKEVMASRGIRRRLDVTNVWEGVGNRETHPKCLTN